MAPGPRADLEVGLATGSDVPRILELSNWAAANTSANFATRPESIDQWIECWKATSRLHPWLVARSPEAGGGVVGFARSSPHRKREAYDWTAEVSVYIAPEHHGRGVGTALYRVLIPLLGAQGYVLLLAGITAGHAASERLHARSGFLRCGTFQQAGWKFGRWHDVGYWQLVLQPADHAPAPITPVSAAWPVAWTPKQVARPSGPPRRRHPTGGRLRSVVWARAGEAAAVVLSGVREGRLAAILAAGGSWG